MRPKQAADAPVTSAKADVGAAAMSSGLLQRVERRLAAIPAADVAGYSRPMEADEEGTLRRLKALRAEIIDPKIAGHRGCIVNQGSQKWRITS